jgi:hypothetical protein
MYLNERHCRRREMSEPKLVRSKPCSNNFRQEITEKKAIRVREDSYMMNVLHPPKVSLLNSFNNQPMTQEVGRKG